MLCEANKCLRRKESYKINYIGSLARRKVIYKIKSIGSLECIWFSCFEAKAIYMCLFLDVPVPNL
jgi:hypothetical protein